MSEISKPTTKLTHEKLLVQNPELWQPKYGENLLLTQMFRLQSIRDSLARQYTGDPEFEAAYEQTQLETERYFAEYSGEKSISTPGSFAFIVPTRIERMAPGLDDEYASEADSLFPLLRYTDISTKQVFMAGMCPFIIDRYHTGDDGRAGAIVFAPVLADMKKDIPNLVELAETITRIMNDTTDFAKHRLGVDLVAFAAMLPKLTNYGKSIMTPELVTTTGHGATVALVAEALQQARERQLTRDGTLDRIGIVGTGAIGAATAAVLLETKLTNDIVMTDRSSERGNEVISRLTKQYPNANLAFSNKNTDAINDRSATVAAVAARFDLTDPSWLGADLDGAWIVDDSQPGAFSLQQVEERGGHVVWPIGLDETKNGIGTLLNFEYGEKDELKTGPASKNELFGCEAEATVIHASGRRELSINDEVTPEQVLAISAVMKEVGVGIAEPQCLGRYIA
ncbi:MAG: hypothetical protein Q7T74_02800 [Candidatus Saccharibacteria bacterium]|nr:hypothetical protein [Candidatus Saccharibacteria bacterium]